MDKNRRPQPRTDVGRTGREVAELVVERIGHPITQLGVETLDDAERVGDVEAGMERLNAQMVFFVDHDPNAARQVDGSTRPDRLLVEPRQLLAHQVPLVEQKSVFRWELVDAYQHTILYRPQTPERLPDLGQDA